MCFTDAAPECRTSFRMSYFTSEDINEVCELCQLVLLICTGYIRLMLQAHQQLSSLLHKQERPCVHWNRTLVLNVSSSRKA